MQVGTCAEGDLSKLFKDHAQSMKTPTVKRGTE